MKAKFVLQNRRSPQWKVMKASKQAFDDEIEIGWKRVQRKNS